MKRRNFLAASIAATVAPSVFAQTKASKPTPATLPRYQVLFRADGRRYVYRIPGLLTVGNTVLVVANQQQSKTQSDHSVVAGVLRRSINGGRTFQPMQTIATPEPGFSISCGSLIADETTGRIFCWGGRGPHLGVSAAYAVTHAKEIEAKGRYHHYTFSDDNGKTWSPRNVYKVRNATGQQVGPVAHGIQIQRGPHKGRLVYPARTHVGYVPGLAKYSHNCTIISDDHGLTWRFGGLTQAGTGEGSIVELSDGRLWMTSRNEYRRGARCFDWSFDGGETFPVGGIDKRLPCPGCHAGVARYKNMILHCGVAGPGRTHLVVRVSYDDCKTWPVSKVIWAGHAAYADIGVLANGTVLVLYESGKATAYEEIRLARFSVKWLEAK